LKLSLTVVFGGNGGFFIPHHFFTRKVVRDLFTIQLIWIIMEAVININFFVLWN